MIRSLRYKIFFNLLFWFCANELDQFELWKMKTKFGWVWIEISRKEPEGKLAYEDMTE